MRQQFFLCMVVICGIFISCSKSDSILPVYTPPVPVSGKTYSADEIAAFKQMTLSSTNNIVEKWPAHISVYLADTSFPYLSHELDSMIKEINGLLDTNLSVIRTNDRATSTMQLYLTDRNTYLHIEPSTIGALQNSNYTGYAWLNWNNGLINHASAFVDMQRTLGDTLQQRYILHHEIMHALGFPGHVSLSQFYTIMFAYTLSPYILDYTLFDKKMMLLLYNPAVRPDSRELEFDTVVRNL